MAAVGVLPAGGLYLGTLRGSPQLWMVVAIGLVMLVLSMGWPSLSAVPAPNSARAVLVFTSVVALFLAGYVPESQSAVLVAIGLGLPAAFVRELTRPAPRSDLVRSVAGTTCGVMAVAVTSLWVTAAQTAHFEDLAWVAAGGIGSSCLVMAIKRSEVMAAVAVAVAAGVGTGLSFLVGTPWWGAAGVAAVCAVAPAALWVAGEGRSILAGRLVLGDLAFLFLPLAVAAVPVWAAQLMR
ncbi:MAG: hypothetical protein LBO75_01605 [Bifidobacteriaceae bacterium]|nr:hypothetical protein [Bifidobacteriaceae bacterium]